MNATLSGTLKAALLASGHYARRLLRDVFPGVAVLCYHGVRREEGPAGAMTFAGLHVHCREIEAHCRLLSELCHPISLSDWRAARAGGRPLPARPVLVTFDDGYRTVFTLARPMLDRYRIPAVVFVCSDPVEQRRLFWHDAVARAQGEREVEHLKELPFDAWYATQAASALAAADDDPNAPLTIAEVRALAETPGFEIGAHSATHAVLACATVAQQREQITRSKQRLEAWTGRPVTAFAYPNGRPGHDYTATTVTLLAASGFDAAFTTRHGFATPNEPALERSRLLMLAGVSAAELAHRLCHSWRR